MTNRQEAVEFARMVGSAETAERLEAMSDAEYDRRLDAANERALRSAGAYRGNALKRARYRLARVV